MATFRSFLCLIIVYSLLFGLANADASIQRRQDGTAARDTGLSDLPDLATASTGPSSTTSQASVTSVASGTPKSSGTATRESSTHPTHSRTTTSAPAITSNSDGVRTYDNHTTSATPDPLPLQPRITPAFGVGGAILIITGSVIAFVGIQHKLIYIFLSAAYLASLSVTVLILYVMSPPVPDATQGAYLVAITATGIGFGAGAMLFPDLTEGFGCFLGGFCLSMWLLVLKPGGLLTSTLTVSIFIVSLSVGIWSTAYIPFTQPYGLILSLAFSGATVIVLGIDCFSRAGLKEFWLYIWQLNEDVFPLNTNTYPVTHGIRVESAVVIMITAVGILTQMRLWSFIKKRRDRKAAAKAEQRKDLDREEETAGRRVEWENTRLRKQWETTYGDAANNETKTTLSTDSGIGNMSPTESKTPQIIVQTEQVDEIEMADIPSPTESAVAGSFAPSSGPSSSRPASSRRESIRPESNRLRRKSRDEIALAALEGVQQPASSRQSSVSNRKSGSEDPLSSTLELDESMSSRDSHRQSAGSKIIDRLSNNSVAPQKHLSAGSRILHRLTHNSSTALYRPQSKQGLTDADENWDRSSSIAATIDYLDSDVDYDDLRSLPSGTPRASMFLDNVIKDGEGEVADAANEAFSADDVAKDISSVDDAAKHPADATPTGDATKETPSPIDAPTKLARVSAEPPSPPASLRKSLLPPAPPKVTTTFRTQEWAKHLSLADSPAAPPIEYIATSPYSPSTPISPSTFSAASDNEAPRPVNPAELAQTATTGTVAPARVLNRYSRTSSQSKRSSSRTSMRQVSNNLPPGMMSRSMSMQNLATPQRVYGSGNGYGYGFGASGGALVELVAEDELSPLRSPYMRPGTAASVYRQSSMPHLVQMVHDGPTVGSMRGSVVGGSVRGSTRGSMRGVGTPMIASRQQEAAIRNSGSQAALGNLSRGMAKLHNGDVTLLEARRQRLLEDKYMAGRMRQEQEIRKRVVEGVWAERSAREGRNGSSVHREGLRRMMGVPEVKV